jgi:hypothetical protein
MQINERLTQFLSDCLRLVLKDGHVTPTNVFAHAKPELLAGYLSQHPEQRAFILLSASGIYVTIGTRMSVSSTKDILTNALDEKEVTEVDPSLRTPARMLSAIPFPDWAMILPKEISWSIILSTDWYHSEDAIAMEIVKYMLDSADRYELLTPDEKLLAVTVTALANGLSDQLRKNLLTVAMTDGLAQRPYNGQSVFESVTNEILVRTIGVQRTIETVFKAIAEKYALTAKPTSIDTSLPEPITGKTLTPLPLEMGSSFRGPSSSSPPVPDGIG